MDSIGGSYSEPLSHLQCHGLITTFEDGCKICHKDGVVIAESSQMPNQLYFLNVVKRRVETMPDNRGSTGKLVSMGKWSGLHSRKGTRSPENAWDVSTPTFVGQWKPCPWGRDVISAY